VKPSFNRREFLRHSVKYGTLAAGAVVASALLEGCGDHSVAPQTTTSSTSTTTTTLGPATASDWKTLAQTMTGALVLPSTNGYATDRLLYNSKFVDLHPQAIAYCASSDDVARCVEFVTSHDIDVAARSGGHSYGGYSNSNGLVIDVSRMATITVDTQANTATVGAGAHLIDVYNVIGSNNRLLPGGSCPTVGIAGLTLGGGIGVFGRKYGLTCDNLQSVNIVTPDATLVTANGQNNADLLWACQGGGGGNYGVATTFQFAVHPMPEISLFTLQYPWSAATDMLGAWQEWIGTMPDELWSNCQLLSEGTAGYAAQMSGVFCGSLAELDSLLAPLKSAIPTPPTGNFQGSNEYLSAMEIEAGCSGLTVASCHLPSQNPDGRLSRSAYSAKSSYVDGPMNAAQLDQIVSAVVNLKSNAPTIGGGLAFDAYGGAINRIASDQTAFVHRDKLACIQATYSWSTYTPQSVISAGQAWLTWLGGSVFDPLSGAYQNYIDPTLEDWQTQYYGSNLTRLEQVKKKYDPEDVFTFAQSIPVAT
jgi:hypothetical protein